mgnify:CR=1 FL=1
MDLTRFDTKDAAETGRKLHMRHPFKGHLLYVGEGAAEETGRLSNKSKPHEPVTITVRGFHSESVAAHLRSLSADRLKNGDEDIDADENADNLIDLLVTGWENITGDDGEPRPCDRKNKVLVVRSNSDFELQVVNFARDQANFFGKPAKT